MLTIKQSNFSLTFIALLWGRRHAGTVREGFALSFEVQMREHQLRPIFPVKPDYYEQSRIACPTGCSNFGVVRTSGGLVRWSQSTGEAGVILATVI